MFKKIGCFIAALVFSCSLFAQDIHTSLTGQIGHFSGGGGQVANDSRCISVLNSAHAGDDVYILINGPGGSINVGVRIMQAVQSAMHRGARVHFHVTSFAASMDAILAFSGTDVVVDSSAQVYFHEAGYMKGNKYIKFTSRNSSSRERSYYRHLMDETAGKIMTRQELNKLEAGKDYPFSGSQVRYRLTHHIHEV